MATAPRRVQVTGDRFHPRVPDGAIYVGRPAPHLKRSPFAGALVVVIRYGNLLKGAGE